MPRIKLSEQYHNEREEICKKLIDILKLDDNNSFLLCELDENIEKQTSILAMKDEIQKCFAVSSISTFKPSLTDVKRDYLNIVRGILRQQGYIFVGSNFVSKIDDTIYKKTMKYIIFRK
jgi:hypothetical protein